MIVQDPVKMIVYSPPGHGKTTLLGSAAADPRLSPMLLIEFEGGTMSIKSKIEKVSLDDLGKKKPKAGTIHSVEIRSWKDFDQVYDFLLTADHPYRSIGLDSLSEMNYLNLQTILDEAHSLDKKHDEDVLEQRDYLKSASQMRRLVRYFRDLPMHVFMTSGAQQGQDPRTKTQMMMLALTGKLAFEIPGLFDIVGYLAMVDQDDGTTERWLFTQPTGRFDAKDRTEGGRLGEYVVNPTLPMILDLIEKKQ